MSARAASPSQPSRSYTRRRRRASLARPNRDRASCAGWQPSVLDGGRLPRHRARRVPI